MYSSFQLVALSLHQTVTDKFYRYRSPINWDRNNKEWVLEHSSMFFWKFLNFVIGFGILACIFVLFDAFYNPGKYHIFIVFFVLIECMLGITSIITCCIILENSADSVSGANALHTLSSRLGNNPTMYLKSICDAGNKKCLKSNTKRFQNSLRMKIGDQVDFIGCASIIIVVGCILLPILLTPIALVLKLDAPYYLLQEYCTGSEYHYAYYVVLVFRVFVAEFCVLEACNTFRNVAVLSLTMLQNIRLCVVKIFALKPKLGALKALKLVLVHLNSLTSALLTVYLGMIFVLEIICMTGSVVAVGRVPWYMYVFFPWIALQVFAFIVVTFSVLIYINSESKRLKQHWVWWCAGKGSKFFILWKLKIKYRQLKALQPIGFTYASLGTVTKSTRTDYYYSVLNYSISLILASR